MTNLNEFVSTNEFVDIINDHLLRNNMTTKTLSLKLCRRQSQIKSWLSGKHNLTLKNISEICVCLNLKLSITIL